MHQYIITDVHPLSRTRYFLWRSRDQGRISFSRHICRVGANTWRKFCRSFEQKELVSMEALWRAFSKYLGQDKVFKLERLPDNFLTFASKTYTERMDWYRSKSFQLKFIWPTKFSMVSWSSRKFAYTWDKLCLWISGLGLCLWVRCSSFYYTPVVSGNQ